MLMTQVAVLHMDNAAGCSFVTCATLVMLYRPSKRMAAVKDFEVLPGELACQGGHMACLTADAKAGMEWGRVHSRWQVQDDCNIPRLE